MHHMPDFIVRNRDVFLKVESRFINASDAGEDNLALTTNFNEQLR